jgi:hypothetical protein
MTEQDKDRKAGAQATRDRDAAGGVEGGMASGSAGGPGQDELERAEPRQGAGAGDDASGPKAGEKVMGDLGQGSFEQTQGGADAGRGRS